MLNNINYINCAYKTFELKVKFYIFVDILHNVNKYCPVVGYYDAIFVYYIINN